MNAPNTPKQIPMPQPVAGFTQRELNRFVSQQLFTLAHYAHIAKYCNEEEIQTALQGLGDTLFELHQLIDGAEHGTEGSAGE